MRDLESIYQAIGNALNAQTGGEFEVAFAEHEIAAAGGISQCKGFVQRERGGEPESVPLDPSAHQAFSDLLAVFRASGKPAWRLARFTLSPGGTFEMQFAFDEDERSEPAAGGGSRTGY